MKENIIRKFYKEFSKEDLLTQTRRIHDLEDIQRETLIIHIEFLLSRKLTTEETYTDLFTWLKELESDVGMD